MNKQKYAVRAHLERARARERQRRVLRHEQVVQYRQEIIRSHIR